MKSDIKYTFFHNMHFLKNSFDKILKGMTTLFTRNINGMEDFDYAQRLKKLKMYSMMNQWSQLIIKNFLLMPNRSYLKQGYHSFENFVKGIFQKMHIMKKCIFYV